MLSPANSPRSAAAPAPAPEGTSSAGSPALGSIAIRDLSMVFTARRGSQPVPALQDVNLDIRGSEFVSLVGASGSGKSTLLKILAGLQPATTGSVEIDGTRVDRPRPGVAMMFQQPELFPWRSALENALLPIDVRRQPRRAHEARALEILRLVGLEGFEHAYPRELSGGMQQRVALSRTLMADPHVLLMDEPFGALDELTRERLDFELLRIWERERPTVAFVTHNIAEAVLLSDRVIVLSAHPGRVVDVVTIDLPRPRTVETIRDPSFVDRSFAIRALLGMPA